VLAFLHGGLHATLDPLLDAFRLFLYTVSEFLGTVSQMIANPPCFLFQL